VALSRGRGVAAALIQGRGYHRDISMWS